METQSTDSAPTQRSLARDAAMILCRGSSMPGAPLAGLFRLRR
jgi:hypothetical protein